MEDQIDVQQQILEHAQRQTKALESIHGVLLFFLAAFILGAVVALALVVNG